MEVEMCTLSPLSGCLNTGTLLEYLKHLFCLDLNSDVHCVIRRHPRLKIHWKSNDITFSKEADPSGWSLACMQLPLWWDEAVMDYKRRHAQIQKLHWNAHGVIFSWSWLIHGHHTIIYANRGAYDSILFTGSAAKKLAHKPRANHNPRKPHPKICNWPTIHHTKFLNRRLQSQEKPLSAKHKHLWHPQH